MILCILKSWMSITMNKKCLLIFSILHKEQMTQSNINKKNNIPLARHIRCTEPSQPKYYTEALIQWKIDKSCCIRNAGDAVIPSGCRLKSYHIAHLHIEQEYDTTTKTRIKIQTKRCAIKIPKNKPRYPLESKQNK